MTPVRHYLFPEHPQHRKAHLLRPPAFLFYIGFLVLLHVTFTVLVRVQPGILGFSTSITAQELTQMTNEKRAEHGLPPLRYNETLVQAASAKAQNMIEQDYWSHVSPTGVDPWYWIKESGYHYRFAGENLAKDFVRSSDVVSAWMNSPTHRDNILNDKYQDIGIVVMDGEFQGYQTTLVVQMFGATSATAPLADTQAGEATAQEPASELVDGTRVAGQEIQVAQDGSQADQAVDIDVSNLARETVGAVTPPEGFSKPPLLDSFAIIRATSISLLLLLLGIVGMDIIIVARRRVRRVGSHSFAHALMLGLLLIAVWYTQVGAVL